MSTKEAMGGGCCSTSSASAHTGKHQGFEELSVKSGEQSSSRAGSSGSWTMYIIIGLAVVLLVFSAVQTFQINKTEDSLVTGFSVGGRPAGGSPANVQIPQVAPAAPRMVGGC